MANLGGPVDFQLFASAGYCSVEDTVRNEFINLIRNETNVGGVSKKRGESVQTLPGSITRAVVEYLEENVYAALTLDDICSHFMQGKSSISVVSSSLSSTSAFSRE